jgi:hypothetical protein
MLKVVIGGWARSIRIDCNMVGKMNLPNKHFPLQNCPMGMGHGSSEGVLVEWQFAQLSLLVLQHILRHK